MKTNLVEGDKWYTVHFRVVLSITQRATVWCGWDEYKYQAVRRNHKKFC